MIFSALVPPPTLGGPDDHILDIPPGGLKSSQMGHRRPQEAQEGPRRPQDASRRPPSERDKLHIQCRFVVFSALVAQPHLGDILCPSPILGGGRRLHVRYPPKGAPGSLRRPQTRLQEATGSPRGAPGCPRRSPGGPRRPSYQNVSSYCTSGADPCFLFCSCAPHTLGGLDDHMLDTPPGSPRKPQRGLRRPQEAQEPQEASGGPQEAPGGHKRPPYQNLSSYCTSGADSLMFSDLVSPPYFGGPRRPPVRYPPLGAPGGFRKPQRVPGCHRRPRRGPQVSCTYTYHVRTSCYHVLTYHASPHWTGTHSTLEPQWV